MDEARYLRRGALIFISLAIFVVLLASVKVGSGNMIPGVPGDAFSLAFGVGFIVSVAVAIEKW